MLGVQQVNRSTVANLPASAIGWRSRIRVPVLSQQGSPGQGKPKSIGKFGSIHTGPSGPESAGYSRIPMRKAWHPGQRIAQTFANASLWACMVHRIGR